MTSEDNFDITFDDGSSAEMTRLEIGTRNKFVEYFDGADTVKAITYSESPEKILELFEERDINQLEVLVGNVEDYRDRLTGKPRKAEKLEKLRREGSLIIYTTPGWGVHSKQYIIERDEERLLIDTSANLSKTGWGNQINTAEVWRTEGGTPIDESMDTSFEEVIDKYGEEFMKDLTERVDEEADTEKERKEIIQMWVDGKSTQKDDIEEINEDLTSNVLQVANEPDTVPDETPVTQSLREFELPDSVINTMEKAGLTVTGNTIQGNTQNVSKYYERQYGIPTMGFTDDELVIQLPNQETPSSLTSPLPDNAEKIDNELAKVEEYIETVDTYGELDEAKSNAVKSHMFEALLWFMWAPFVNKYAERYRQYGINLDKNLPYLYIHGPSDAGKGTFAQYAMSLISDGGVQGAEDADNVGKNEIKMLRKTDTVFPYVVDDIPKKQTNRLDTLRNFWSNWDGQTNYPACAFISNDKVPNSWFRNRSKLLYFDVYFDSTKKSEAEVNQMIDRENKIYEWISHILIQNNIEIKDNDDTLCDIRDAYAQLYDKAEREQPEYFPAEKPAEQTHDTRKELWESALENNLFQYNEKNGNLIIDFTELEPNEVYKYERRLPPALRPEKQGNRILIKSGKDQFENWLDISLNTGLISTVKNKLT